MVPVAVAAVAEGVHPRRVAVAAATITWRRSTTDSTEKEAATQEQQKEVKMFDNELDNVQKKMMGTERWYAMLWRQGGNSGEQDVCTEEC